ncbi:LysR substrate-binding domain-containing protein [Rhizobium sp. NRK18]|uniref:LysR substrate-binding domain-containing protein n=1 Tax=Rhizobium sp. NRK18 TaxID=2964667 RepID=UPI0021C29357|nr:LysR substrate-binding domain-containing protein [Rhizobium sp. NRK18]MCQ2004131.1 LysR substrate-binding domain-containing protein [Rhizobium sp. NRK18]
MTFEQLTIFVAVAERQHVTRAADALGLTPSAVSAAIKALENFYNVSLFDRVGRGIRLTRAGVIFLQEARETLARAKAASLVLSELGGLKRGTLEVQASQTVASYWLPPRLMRFHERYPEIDIRLQVGNTDTVSRAIRDGAADMGFIEGEIDEPALSKIMVGSDEIGIIVDAASPLATLPAGEAIDELRKTRWIMREKGSGTRSVFESAIATLGLESDRMSIALILPSNESILTALIGSSCAAAVSKAAAEPFVATGRLRLLDLALPPRRFYALCHKERHLSRAAHEFLHLCGGNLG